MYILHCKQQSQCSNVLYSNTLCSWSRRKYNTCSSDAVKGTGWSLQLRHMILISMPGLQLYSHAAAGRMNLSCGSRVSPASISAEQGRCISAGLHRSHVIPPLPGGWVGGIGQDELKDLTCTSSITHWCAGHYSYQYYSPTSGFQ